MNIFTKIKETHHFTESEQLFANYILEYPREVVAQDIKTLAKNSYVSVSTIYRVIEKLGLSGLNQLKVQISLQFETNTKTETNVDYNYPFKKNHTHHQIMNQMYTLYEQTLQSTLHLVDLDIFLKVIQTLQHAKSIILYPSIGNYFMAESFQQNMLEIGVKTEVIKEHFYQHWYAQAAKPGDVVMVISYAGRTPYLKETVLTLKEQGAKIILISSTIAMEISKYADYHLYFASYEDSEEKIASFSSRVSLQYLLDCIYACYFNRDYEKHLRHKIDHYID